MDWHFQRIIHGYTGADLDSSAQGRGCSPRPVLVYLRKSPGWSGTPISRSHPCRLYLPVLCEAQHNHRGARCHLVTMTRTHLVDGWPLNHAWALPLQDLSQTEQVLLRPSNRSDFVWGSFPPPHHSVARNISIAHDA